MSDNPEKKKLTMKEKLRLKKEKTKLENKNNNNEIKEFVPTQKTEPQPSIPQSSTQQSVYQNQTHAQQQTPQNQYYYNQQQHPNQMAYNNYYIQNPMMIQNLQYMNIDEFHQMFEDKKISIEIYSKFFETILANMIIRKKSSLHMNNNFNFEDYNSWERSLINNQTKRYWYNYFLYHAVNTQINKEMLAKCLQFLDFEQIDRIIQTYRINSLHYIEKYFKNNPDEKKKKLLEIEEYIKQINDFLNDKLDKIERSQNYNNYNQYNDYNEEMEFIDDKKMKKKKKKKPQPQQPPKKLKVKEKKKKTFNKQEEVIDVNELLQEQEKKVEEKGERAKLNLFNRNKEPLNIIFIGHVDCGKSTICGNILVKSGKVNELEIKKFQQEAQDKDRESWFLAYIMDLNEEERSKGKTVEVGRATFETKNKRFTILDCPGHEKYLINMLSGAAQADVASLVISAKPGEFESGFEKNGQTKEHAMLAKALGVQRLVIVVNKMDLVDWSKERFDYIQNNLGDFLKNNCGYEEKDIFWTIISGLHGTNLDKRMDSSLAPWFYGQSLFETLDSLPKIEKNAKPFLRIPLLDKYKDQGNCMVFGKIESGVVKSNMKCTLMPSQKEVEVAKIFDNDDNPMLFAEPGENVKLQLKGCELEEIKRGYVICGQQFWCNVSQEFIAEIKVLELNNTQIFNEGFTLIMHLHTVLQEVTVKKIKKRIDVDGNEDKEFRKKKIRKLQSQERGEIILRTEVPICLEKYEEFSELGRFTLRKDNNTIAIGRITKYKPFDRELLEYTNFFMYEKNNQGNKKQ